MRLKNSNSGNFHARRVLRTEQFRVKHRLFETMDRWNVFDALVTETKITESRGHTARRSNTFHGDFLLPSNPDRNTGHFHFFSTAYDCFLSQCHLFLFSTRSRWNTKLIFRISTLPTIIPRDVVSYTKLLRFERSESMEFCRKLNVRVSSNKNFYRAILKIRYFVIVGSITLNRIVCVRKRANFHSSRKEASFF